MSFLALQLGEMQVASPSPLESTPVGSESLTISALELLNSYAPVFVVAFVVALLGTPVARYFAIRGGVVDLPNDPRKMHRRATPYLGGVAIFVALMAAIAVSYIPHRANILQAPVPLAVIIGMAAITVTGLADDVWGWDPRLKIAGQLVAAAGLAISSIGVDVATGLLNPFLGGASDPLFGSLEAPFAIGGRVFLNGDLYYWLGTAIIAIFVLGGCNAANFLDGLDGLAISLLASPELMPGGVETEGSLGGARIVLCLALLGATLGFLPHNFNPATIFLGDSGSLLLGFMCVVVILMFGEQARSHLVFAGLIVFGLPIMDTTLAIIRRKLAGVPLSAADSHHIHHQLQGSLGGVKRAVLALYGISLAFGILGVTLAALVVRTELRYGMVYAIVLVLFGFMGVIAVKAAQRQRLDASIAKLEKRAGDSVVAKDVPRATETNESSV
jgi:UDP-GlcNAc:undecaprenyl-phosphate GlcNAc-1-phosphate transferase